MRHDHRLVAPLALLFAAACADAIPGREGDEPDPGSSGDAWTGQRDDSDAGAGGANGPGSSSGEEGPGDPLAGSREAFCAGEGAIVELGDREQVVHRTCTGDIAEMLFTNALCVCEDARMAGYLLTRGFDSRQGPAGDDDDALGGGAPVGVNRSFEVGAGYTDVGGSLAIAGAEALSFAGFLKVAGDLRLAGAALVAGYVSVGRDAWLGQDLTLAGPMSVARDLHHQGNVVAIPLAVDGQTTQEAVRVEPPCPCDELLDVGQLVAQVRARNDNEQVGLDPRRLTQVVGAVRISLPCGRFYVDEISGIGDIQIDVGGRVALMVGGPVAVAGNLQVNLAPGAEIDLFIEGDLGSIGNSSFGDRDRPAATRIYVGGANEIVLVGASAFVGNVYAPQAKLTAPGFLQAYGSFFVRRFEVPGFARIIYDRAVTEIGCEGDPDNPDNPAEIPDDPPDNPDGEPGDPPPPPDVACTRCGYCRGGFACVDGYCGDCRADNDCCGQQICEAGRCVNLQ